jgi:hypothetical protein
MLHPQYRKYEALYLGSVATELELTGEYRVCFTKRSSFEHDKYNTETKLAKDPEFLKAVFPKDYREDDSAWLSDTAVGVLKETLRKAKKNIQQKNWSYNEQKIVNWKDLVNFLRNDHFSQWWSANESQLFSQLASSDQLWKRLWDRVTNNDRISIKKIAEKRLGSPNTLGVDFSVMTGNKAEEIAKFSWQDKLIYKIMLKQPGYLILLEKSPDALYCFAPSFLVENFLQPVGETIFPCKENPAQLDHIPLEEGMTGMEEIIAIISQEKPNFTWLSSEKKAPLALDENNLQELLDFVVNNQESEIIGTKYLITAPIN